MKHDCSKVEFFNGHAENWDSISPTPTAERLKEVIALAGSIPFSSILDVGCGTGVLVPQILDALHEHGKLFAIDPAQEMLRVLKHKYSDERIETRCEKLEDSSLPDSSLEVIICFSCFPHVSDKEKALKNSHRMLKNSGKLVVAHVSSRKELNSFHADCSDPVRRDVLPNEIEMRRLMQKAELKVIYFRDEPGRYEIVAQKS